MAAGQAREWTYMNRHGTLSVVGRVRLLWLLTVLATSVPARGAEKIVKQTLGSGGRTRTYYVLQPDRARQASASPLLVLLHGSGGDGRSLVEKWERLAKNEGVIVAGPNALRSDAWRLPEDGPDFLYDLVETLRMQYPVDPARIYLFGYSAGARHALMIGLLESGYFAAVGVYAGALQSSQFSRIDLATRKTPIAMWAGTDDTVVPPRAVRATRDALNARGFSAELVEMSGHGHAYDDAAPRINDAAWRFLRQHRLPGEPTFQRYDFRGRHIPD